MLKIGKFRRIRRKGLPPTVPRWSDPATWDGSIPAAGENVVVPVGAEILLDVNTADLGLLTLSGTLRVDPAAADVTLRCKGILINSTGKLKIGAAGQPHTGRVTIELNAPRPAAAIVGASHNSSNVPTGNPNDSFMGVAGLARGIINDGGEIEIYALIASTLRTKLSASAAAAAATLSVSDTLAWPLGASVMVAPTGFYNNQNTEQFTLVSPASGSTVSLSSGLAASRWGVMQYLTDTGVSLSPGTFSTMRRHADQRSTLDQRAKVAMLTRNVVIQAPNDSEWTTKRFGVHIMTMQLGSKMIMEGVEMRRCGQGGLLGRYPIHWHMLSYNQTTGANLGNVNSARHRVKNCSIWQSENRSITIHGTRGVDVIDNVSYDIKGHAIFLEDGSEEDNRIIGNWVGRVRDPGAGWRIKLHDQRPAGFWITNANNEIRLNSSFDCQGLGFWNAYSYDRAGFPGGCFGASSQVAIHPFYTPPKVDGSGNPLYDDNESHSNNEFGNMLNDAVIDEQGTTRDTSAPAGSPEINGPRFKSPANVNGTHVNGIFSRFYLWKNQKGGYQNRVVNPIYRNWVQADNLGTDFFGATLEGQDNEVQAPVLVCESNNVETPPAGMPTVRNGFASYHGALDFVDVTAYDYELGTPTVTPGSLPYNTYGLLMAGSVMQTWDFYTNAVEMGTGRHRNWALWNSAPIYRTPPAHIINDAYDAFTGNQPQDIPGVTRRWTIAGALYDHNGVMGAPAGRYIIFDHPFLTTGLTTSTVMSPAALMTRHTPDHFYGIQPKGDDTGDVGFSDYLTPITFRRLDSSLNPIAGAVWDLIDGAPGSFFKGMRHGCVPRGAYVRMQLPVRGVSSSYMRMRIWNVSRKSGVNGQTADDFFYLVVDWSGSVPARVFASVGLNGSNDYNPDWATDNRAKEYSNAGITNLAQLQASAGLTYWQDTANNRVVIKVASHHHNWAGWGTGSPITSAARMYDLVVKPKP